MRPALAAFISATFGIIIPAQAATVSDPGLTAVAQRAATTQIKNQLKDAESGQFKFPLPPAYGVLNAMSKSGYFLCGEVNAKNSYGGYTGFRTFLVIFNDSSYNTANEAVIDSGQYSIVTDWCRQVYQ